MMDLKECLYSFCNLCGSTSPLQLLFENSFHNTGNVLIYQHFLKIFSNKKKKITITIKKSLSINNCKTQSIKISNNNVDEKKKMV